MYQVLGLYEDSLVQYDELDALFTQFVVNYAAGGEFIIPLDSTLSTLSLPLIILPEHLQRQSMTNHTSAFLG